ncbi:MAG TPA: hypothetical protein VK672_08105, partial [Solirubrobacteraceae bacterium]|nr:hypothetical protein [Solirubrobacteraceae bacterium]
TTMRFHDEVRASADVAAEIDANAEPTSEQIENAMAIIEELEVPFDPTSYRDEHRAHLERIIKRKRKGQKISVPAPEPEKPMAPTAPDLMGALEQSLARIRGEADANKKAKKTPAKTDGSRAGGAKTSGAKTGDTKTDGSRADGTKTGGAKTGGARRRATGARRS